MILNNAIALNLHIPHGYPMSAGNKKACRDYFPNVNYKYQDPKNCEIFISGNCYVIDIWKIVFTRLFVAGRHGVAVGNV